MAEPEAESKGGCGCVTLLIAFLVISFVVWLPGVLVEALDTWRTPDALDALVPFRGGFLAWEGILLTRDGESLATRLVVGGMIFTVGGLFLGLIAMGLGRIVSEEASDRLVGWVVFPVFIAVFVYTPLSAVLQPRFPVLIDPDRKVIELRKRAVYGPIDAWSSVHERSIPFSAVRGFAYRVGHYSERAGSFTSAELYLRIEGEPKLVPLAECALRSGELDLLGYLVSDETRDRRALEMGAAATATLTKLVGAPDPPRPVREK